MNKNQLRGGVSPSLEWVRLKAECAALQSVYKHREFNCHSGRVTVRQVGIDVWNVGYSGMICIDSFDTLRRDVIKATYGARSMLLRMNKALTLLTPPIPAGTYQLNKAPGVIVVRQDQYEVWAEYARLMARVGVVRAIVLQEEQALAHQMLECFSGQSLSALPPLR